jgi:hypothetical protein
VSAQKTPVYQLVRDDFDVWRTSDSGARTQNSGRRESSRAPRPSQVLVALSNFRWLHTSFRSAYTELRSASAPRTQESGQRTSNSGRCWLLDAWMGVCGRRSAARTQESGRRTPISGDLGEPFTFQPASEGATVPLLASRRTAAHQSPVSSGCCTASSGLRTPDSGSTAAPGASHSGFMSRAQASDTELYAQFRSPHTRFRSHLEEKPPAVEPGANPGVARTPWWWLHTGLRRAHTKFRSDPRQPLRPWLRPYRGAHAIPVGARESTVNSRHAVSCPPRKTSGLAIGFGWRTWNSGERTPIAGRAGFSSRRQPGQATRSTHPAD